MSTEKRSVLYITYDGLTDPLGQSQVIPYLMGIAKEYPNITVLSAEKKVNFSRNQQFIKELIRSASLKWKPIVYHKTPPVLSTIFDIYKLSKEASKICKTTATIVHCRSYIAALVGLRLKNKYNAKLVFDMRGFWVNERVEGKIWNLNNPIFKWIYNYFKKKEAQFFKQSDAVISLTYRGKKELVDNYNVNAEKIEVIPCCVDHQLFDPTRISTDTLQKLKKELGISEKDLVISYLGSIGTWYMLTEMLHFFKELKKEHQNARFLFITQDSPFNILQEAKSIGLSEKDLIITHSSRQNVPSYLKLSQIALFFIKPIYSKIASSPTKMGEIMSMGIPVICNDKVGDVAEIIHENSCGIAISEFNSEAYTTIVNQIDQLISMQEEVMIRAAKKHFNLHTGVATYLKVYNRLF